MLIRKNKQIQGTTGKYKKVSQKEWCQQWQSTLLYCLCKICRGLKKKKKQTEKTSPTIILKKWVWLYLGVRVLHPRRVSVRGLIGVCLVVKEVKGLFAAAVVGAGRTLHHCESQLHVNLRRSLSLDEATAQPVAG